MTTLTSTASLTPAAAKGNSGDQDKKGAPPEAAAGGDKDKPYGDWKKLTKDAEVLKGYFTAYKKRESLYLEIRPDQMEKPVLGRLMDGLSRCVAAPCPVELAGRWLWVLPLTLRRLMLSGTISSAIAGRITHC